MVEGKGNCIMKCKKLRKELKQLKKHVVGIEKKATRVLKQEEKVRKRIRKVKSILVMKEKLLGATKWKVEIDNTKNIIVLRAFARNCKELVELCASEWGVSLEVEGAGFYEHDGYMEILFYNNKDVCSFIKKYGIELDLTDVNERIKTLQDGLDSIIKVIESAGVKA